MRSAAPITQNHLSKSEDPMLQNATALRKSAPWPPNISDEHVSCIAPATRNASLQILFKCPTPAIVFGHATKPSRFAHFGKVQNPWRLPRETTSERPKVVRACGGFNMLTWKCASHDNGVHFLNISTSKSAPSLACFTFQRCFAPQRPALFRRLNFQKCSENGCVLRILTPTCASRHNGVHFFNISIPKKCSEAEGFYTFWLGNVLRATTVCNFSFLIYPEWLLTRRFSEPTFRASGATNHGKNAVIRDFLPLRAPASSFFWFFLSSDLLSSFLLFSDSSHLCFFICPYCRKFDF